MSPVTHYHVALIVVVNAPKKAVDSDYVFAGKKISSTSTDGFSPTICGLCRPPLPKHSSDRSVYRLSVCRVVYCGQAVHDRPVLCTEVE